MSTSFQPVGGTPGISSDPAHVRNERDRQFSQGKNSKNHIEREWEKRLRGDADWLIRNGVLARIGPDDDMHHDKAVA